MEQLEIKDDEVASWKKLSKYPIYHDAMLSVAPLYSKSNLSPFDVG